MRIRRTASRLLGSGYFVPQAPAPDAAHSLESLTPPPPMPLQGQEPCLAPESLAGGSLASSAAACGETCELSRSPWDLIADLSLSDPQVTDELMDEYLVTVTCRASWLFAPSMPVASASASSKKKKKPAVRGGGRANEGSTSRPRDDLPKKLAAGSKKQEISEDRKKKAKVKKDEQEAEVMKQQLATYKCKKNDGKLWQCHRPVGHPNTLCDYHFYQKRAYLDPDFAAVAAAEAELAEEVKVEQPRPAPPAASKPAAAASSKPAASTSKPRKKKKKPGHDAAATEGFYYYAGFGPFRSKRQCRSSSNMNEPVPPVVVVTPKKDEVQEEDEPAAAYAASNNAADGPRGDKQAAAAAHDQDASSCDDITGIAGGDEVESSEDDESYRLGGSGRRVNCNNGGEHRDGKRKNGLKRWRKPVKARSLKSLM